MSAEEHAGSAAAAGGRAGLAVVACAAALGATLAALAPSAAGPALVFAVAVGALVWTARRPWRGPRVLGASLFLFTFAALVVPATIGAVSVLRYIGKAWPLREATDDPAVAAVLVVPALLVAAALAWRGSDRRFVVVVLLLVGAAKLGYVLAVEAVAVSDFERMWSIAGSIEQNAAALLDPAPNNRIFVERILPYLLPLRLLLGPSSLAYGVTNVAASLATALGVAWLARHWFGRVAGRVATAISACSFEALISSEIPTHEIPGALLVVAGFVLLVTAWRLAGRDRLGAALLVAAVLGLDALLLDLQRGIGHLLLLACTLPAAARLVSAWRAGRPHRFLAAMMILPPVVFQLGDAALRGMDLRVPRERTAQTFAGMGLASSTDTWGDGTYTYAVENYRPYGRAKVSWTRLAALKILSSTHYHPAARLALYVRKSAGLFALGGQTYFYVPEARIAGRALEGAAGRFLLVSFVFTAGFLFAFIPAILLVWRSSNTTLEALAPLFFLASLSAILLLVGEVQSRYLYSTWYLGSIYVGAMVAAHRERTGRAVVGAIPDVRGPAASMRAVASWTVT